VKDGALPGYAKGAVKTESNWRSEARAKQMQREWRAFQLQQQQQPQPQQQQQQPQPQQQN
jgi:hypothetical protein